jgi:hypothetical protein
MYDVMAGDATDLAAFVRNRYFYGKLLDVSHLEMEQCYLNEKRWLLNRAGLGTGVLCGLELEAQDGKVLVRPGVAIDGHGREVVVTDPYVIADPLALTDDCGRPTGETAERFATLCLAFHECDVDPTPVLVTDCDTREECRPGAVRERFRVLVHDGRPDLSSPLDCPGDEEEREEDEDPRGPRDERERSFMPRPSHHTFEAEPVGPRPSAGDADRLRVYAALCERIDHGCGPREPACVPIGVVAPGGDGDVQVIDCGARIPIYSNVALLDIMICLLTTIARRVAERRTLRYEAGDGTADPGAEIAAGATLLDETGAGADGESVTFRVRSGGGQVGDGTNFDVSHTATTASDGRADATWRLGDEEGLNTLEAEGPQGARVVFHALAHKRG